METRETLDFRRSCFEIYPLRIALYPVSAQGESLPRVDLVNLWCGAQSTLFQFANACNLRNSHE
jgi:hypothetical protein